MRAPAVIIAEPVDEAEFDLTGWTIGIFFPAALVGCVLVLIWCLFQNGVL